MIMMIMMMMMVINGGIYTHVSGDIDLEGHRFKLSDSENCYVSPSVNKVD